MEMQFCYSCGMPLEKPTSSHYCQYCVDEKGNLKSAAEVQKGIAQWLESWAPKAKGIDFTARAKSYMKAMPAWNE